MSVVSKYLPHPIVSIINPSRYRTVDSEVCLWHMLEWIPFVSILPGCGEALLGLIHTVEHFVKYIFDSQNREGNWKEVKVGLKTLIRGEIAIVPVLNVALFLIDFYSLYHHDKAATAFHENFTVNCRNHSTIFADNQVLGRKSFEDLNAMIRQRELTTLPDFWTEVSMVLE